MTKDGGNSWNLTSTSLPNRWITSVVADPSNENGCYVTLSGYRFGEFKGHIYKTDDNGMNWTDIGGDLPDIPVNDLIVTPENNDLYIATDVGVFQSKDGGNTWHVLGNNFPSVVVMDLDYDVDAKKMVAATFGRGMMAIDLSDEVAVNDVFRNDIQLSIVPNPVDHQINLQFSTRNSHLLKIHVFDVSGKLVLEKEIVSEIGQQRVTLNASNLFSGVYFVKVLDGNTVIGRSQMVKL